MEMAGNTIFTDMDDEYITLRDTARTELKVQGSRFIALARPVLGKDDALQAVNTARSEFYDASHHCFAYRLGTDDSQFRYNDDGEPSGSAGKPILAAIDRGGLTNVIVVVTRYFGGTKLGVGGLVRAYGGAAELALDAAGRMRKYATGRLEIAFPHALISNVMHVIAKTGAGIADTFYDEEVHMVLEIRRSKLEDLRVLLTDNTSGNLRVK